MLISSIAEAFVGTIGLWIILLLGISIILTMFTFLHKALSFDWIDKEEKKKIDNDLKKEIKDLNDQIQKLNNKVNK